MTSIASGTLCAVLAAACGSVAPSKQGDAALGDAPVCFGRPPFTICLAALPAQPLTIQSPLVVDTTSGSICAAFMGDGQYCVVAATRLEIGATLRATGARPLVLLASDSILVTATATIDAGSHRSRPPGAPEIGAGADPMACDHGAPVGPSSTGGAAGGSFAGLGGAGGIGASNDAGTPGATAGPLTGLRGGCPGGDGAAQLDPAPGGHGGGAVFLIAGTKIDVAGSINAGGEGGGGRTTAGGGGGGSGGTVGFDAPAVTVTGTLVANGGGGGEGANGSGTASARNGDDATALTAAKGGAGGVPAGGDGGSGSAGTAAGSGQAGLVGTAGGGGGGGAGMVLAAASANLGTQVSPAPTRF